MCRPSTFVCIYDLLYHSGKTHKNIAPLIMAVIAGGILFYGNFPLRNQSLSYGGAALLIVAVITDYVIRRRYKAYCEDCVVKTKE